MCNKARVQGVSVFYLVYSKSAAEMMPPLPWFLIICFSLLLTPFPAQVPFLRPHSVQYVSAG